MLQMFARSSNSDDDILSGDNLKSQTESHTFALVIGVDNYAVPGPDSLSGCVGDSQMVFNYLNTVLHVPKVNIMHLTNENASRCAILEAFDCHFMRNHRITKGDAIILYFAGHGGRQRAPERWVAEQNMVEVLCPHDVKLGNGIPDYTLAGLLRRLQYEKGDNITVIIDACHSGGMSRDDDNDPTTTARLYDPPNPLSVDLDSNIWSWTPDGHRSSDDLQPDLPGSIGGAMGTSVLLAACQPQEIAHEITHKVNGVKIRSGGAFTASLLPAMPQSLSDIRVTYYDVISNLPPLKHQTPCCVGKYQHRYIFTPFMDADTDGKFSIIKKSGTYYVTAGDIHGVVPGTIFQSASIDPSFQLRADTVQAHTCSLSMTNAPFPTFSDSPLPKVFIASLELPPDRALSVEIESSIVNTDVSVSNGMHRIVDTGGSLGVICEKGSVRLVRKDPLLMKYSAEIKGPALLDNSYLRAVASFNFYLYHAPGPSHSLTTTSNGGQPLIKLVMKELNLFFGHFVPPPSSMDLFRSPPFGRSSVCSGEATISDTGVYGFQLENNSHHDLFFYIFYFDPQTYSIELWHSSDYPLHHKENESAESPSNILPLLHEWGGWYGRQFMLPDSLDQDSGFIKVFASTKSVNMTHIAASSERLDGEDLVNALSESLWDSWIYVITVIQLSNCADS